MSIYFHYFPIISPLGTTRPFIWPNLNPLHPGILSAKFGWNWPSGFWRRRWKCVKFTDGQTDRQRTTGDQKSSLELSCQVSLKAQVIKQEVHRPHRSPEEDIYIFFFYMFSISFYKLGIISPCRRAWFCIWKKSEFPLPKDA